jgi:hypothetical protein
MSIHGILETYGGSDTAEFITHKQRVSVISRLSASATRSLLKSTLRFGLFRSAKPICGNYQQHDEPDLDLVCYVRLVVEMKPNSEVVLVSIVIWCRQKIEVASTLSQFPARRTQSALFD